MALRKIPNFQEVKDWANNKFTTLSEVNNNADVPNADYADSSGDADTVDGKHASELGGGLPTATDIANANSSRGGTSSDYDTVVLVDTTGSGKLLGGVIYGDIAHSGTDIIVDGNKLTMSEWSAKDGSGDYFFVNPVPSAKYESSLKVQFTTGNATSQVSGHVLWV